jgi:hypothetical protein
MRPSAGDGQFSSVYLGERAFHSQEFETRRPRTQGHFWHPSVHRKTKNLTWTFWPAKISPMRYLMAVLLLMPAVAGKANTLVSIRLEADDLSGHPIASIPVGGDFQLRMFAQDVGSSIQPNGGLFAAFANVGFDSTLVTLDSPITPGPGFFSAFYADTSTPGMILHAGSFSTALNGPGNGIEELIISVPFHAHLSGFVSFSAAFDPAPAGDVLLFLHPDPIPANQIALTGIALTVVPEPPAVWLFGVGVAALFAYRLRRRLAH